MSTNEQYHSEDRRDILGERGHRYKRNTLGLSAAAIVVAAMRGVTINTAALPGVINVGPLSFWILYAGVLAYNAYLWRHHVKQDWLLFQADFERVHLGHRKTLESGETEEFEPSENPLENNWRAICRSSPRGLQVSIQSKQPSTVEWGGGKGGIFISETDLKHVQHKERHFRLWEWWIPLVLCGAAFVAIILQAFNAVTSPAPGITITDGDTLKVNGERVQIVGLNAPKVFKPECLAEKMLCDNATAGRMALK